MTMGEGVLVQTLFLGGFTAILISLFTGDAEVASGNASSWMRSVPEMVNIKEVDGWEYNPNPLTPEEKKAFQTDFLARRNDFNSFITPELVRNLSRWANKQMEEYKEVSLPKEILWVPNCSHGNGDEKRILMEATLEVLPTHSPLVTRWLKGYALFNPHANKIEWIIITIRGERME